MNTLEKVTCFIVNEKEQIALFKHPFAGYQIPSGTVEIGEGHRKAALREAEEESGLEQLEIIKLLGKEREILSNNEFAIYQKSIVYGRPDSTSFDWASIRRGIRIIKNRECGEWSHITYREMNDALEPEYITYEITGWVKSKNITNLQCRYFYLLKYSGPLKSKWVVETDNHHFTLSWYDVNDFDIISDSQKVWLNYYIKPRSRSNFS